MNLTRLRYFVVLAEERHFGRAAARLGIAQPPLTQQIQKLEREVGFSVLDRRARRTSLTDAGRVLLEGAYRVLREVDELREHTQRAGRGETGHLTVGIPPSLMLSGIPASIRRFRDAAPRVHVAIRELSTAAIAEALSRGALDVGILRERDAVGDVAAQLLFEEPVVAVVPRASPAAERRRLSLAHLRHEPFVSFPRRLGGELHDRLMGFCRAAGFTPTIVQEATQWPSIVALVDAGLGVALAPACVERVALAGVVYRRLPGLETRVFVCAPTVSASPTAAAFVRELRSLTRIRLASLGAEAPARPGARSAHTGRM